MITVALHLSSAELLRQAVPGLQSVGHHSLCSTIPPLCVPHHSVHNELFSTANNKAAVNK